VALVALALASPIAIEGLQLAIGVLGRRCQSGDAVDNLTGLGLGLLAAAGARSLMSVRLGSSPLKESEPPRPGIQPDVAGVAGIVLLVMLALLPRPSTAPSHGWPAVGGATTRAPDGAGRSQRVSSIQGLLEALADDGVREIVVADGTYHVSSSARQAADSLWIGDRFALRTKSVTVRAETIGGVTFDGGGTAYFGGISFEDGAHHQTWDGFVFANGEATQTGVITFGGYAGREAPHHITLRNITIPASVTGNATSLSAPTTDHAIYVSEALDGPHDLLFENLTVDGQGGLASGLVFYHSDASNLNAWNVMIRRLRITGTQHGIILWDQTLHDITIEAATITDVLGSAISYESPGATNILLSDVTSTGSGAGTGFQSSLGPAPPGVTFRNTSLN
jgi:hypothetical protein